MAQRAPRKDGGSGQSGGGGFVDYPLLARVREEKAYIERLFGRRIFGGVASVPVGGGTIPVVFTSAGVFKLPTSTTTAQGGDAGAPIDRRDQPSDTQVVPDMTSPHRGGGAMRVAKSWFEYHELKAKGVAIAPPGTVVSGPVNAPPPPPPVTIAPPIPTQPSPTVVTPPTPNGGTMDLGNLVGDLLRQAGTQYINQQFAPSAPSPAFNALDFFDVPGIDVIPQNPGMPTASGGCGHGASPVYKKVCGSYKWVTPKRRKRKRLATQSDLKDLAALKGILGNGKAFEVWIATHS